MTPFTVYTMIAQHRELQVIHNTVDKLPKSLTDKIEEADGFIVLTGENCKEHGVSKFAFNLFSQQCPNGHESIIYQLIANEISGVKDILSKRVDEKGNFYVEIGKSDTIFSSHMDTVHHRLTSAGVPVVQTLMIPDKTWSEKDRGFMYASEKTITLDKDEQIIREYYKRCVIGGDDKCGVLIMVTMIKAGIPGMYIFHIGEEKGCIGSKYIRDNKEAWLKQYKRAIAFDRKERYSIITKQSGQTCCSSNFAKALAYALNKQTALIPPTMQFREDDTGTVTDTKQYMDVIPECTNISCGYMDAHMNTEHVDYYWLTSIFIPAVLNIEWEKLPVVRKAEKPVYSYGHFGNTNYHATTYKQKTVAPHLINEDTKDWELPEIDLDFMVWPTGTNQAAFERLIWKWLDNIQYQNANEKRKKISSLYVKHMLYAEKQEAQVKILNQKLEMIYFQLANPEENNKQLIMGIIENVLNSTEKMAKDLSVVDFPIKKKKREQLKGFIEALPNFHKAIGEVKDNPIAVPTYALLTNMLWLCNTQASVCAKYVQHIPHMKPLYAECKENNKKLNDLLVRISLFNKSQKAA